MQFTFINNSTNTPIDKITLNKNATLLLGDGFLPAINLDDELTGVSNYIKTLCILSRKNDNLILAGCTIYCGKKTFYGTIVVKNGKFLGISDMTHCIDANYDKSNSIRVFECDNLRIGVVSGDDIYFFEVPRLMRLWECDILVFTVKGNLNRTHRIMAEAHSITNGVTCICFGRDRVFVTGTKNCVKRGNDIYITTKRDDTLISNRKPECYLELVKRPSL